MKRLAALRVWVCLVTTAAVALRCTHAAVWDFFRTKKGDAASVINRLGKCWELDAYDQPRCARFPMLYACTNKAHLLLSNIHSTDVKFLQQAPFVDAKRAVQEAVGFLNTSSLARKYSCVDGDAVKQLQDTEATAYDLPDGCQCQRLALDVGDADEVAITTKRCARSTGVYNATTFAKVYELPFAYMGCFVGNASDQAAYANCTTAVPSMRFNGAMFARCVNDAGTPLDATSVDDTYYY